MPGDCNESAVKMESAVTATNQEDQKAMKQEEVTSGGVTGREEGRDEKGGTVQSAAKEKSAAEAIKNKEEAEKHNGVTWGGTAGSEKGSADQKEKQKEEENKN